MQNKSITFKAKMWVWPGDMGWHFVSLDKELSKIIRESYPKSAMVKVRVNIIHANGEKVFIINKKNKKEESVIWDTSLFRNKKDENYILPIKKQIRNKANIWPEEILEIKVEVL